MNTIRLHSYTTDPGFTPNDGSVSADFRGDKFIGSREGDEHKTLAEVDGVSDADVQIALEVFPQTNALLSRLEATAEAPLPAGIAGQIPKLRLGVWDKQAPY